MAKKIIPICQGCGLEPKYIEEYIEGAEDAGMFVNDFVRDQEGTYNPENGHFLCTNCYIEVGMPTSPNGWICP
jgi:hypothetical protein